MPYRSFFALALLGSVSFQADAHIKDRDIDYMPKRGYANTVSSEYVMPSIKKA